MTKHSLLILNGPGLADLSHYGDKRYGNLSLEQIYNECSILCQNLSIDLDFRQTDDEDELYRFIAKDTENFDALIVNPVGYSRSTSVEVEMYRSSIKMIAHLEKPVFEVHITNIFQLGAEITKPLQVPAGKIGFICGLGLNSYLLAIRAADRRLRE